MKNIATHFVRPYSTMKGVYKSMKISELLRHGAENALSAATLCRLAETTPRGLRHYIASERAAGAEILYQPGGHGGYFLPSLDVEQAHRERLAFYNVMRSRALGTFKTLRPVARSLGVPVGQLAFDLADCESDEGENENGRD